MSYFCCCCGMFSRHILHTLIHSSWLSRLLIPACFFGVLTQYRFGANLQTGDWPVARPAGYTHRTAQTQKKHTQMSVTRMRFQPMTPVVEGSKIHVVHDTDYVATVIGSQVNDNRHTFTNSVFCCSRSVFSFLYTITVPTSHETSQLVDAYYENNRCLVSKSYKSHKYSLLCGQIMSFSTIKQWQI
jgi:hypothetical protein